MEYTMLEMAMELKRFITKVNGRLSSISEEVVTSKNWKKFEGKDKDGGKSLKNQSQNKNEWSSGCFICTGSHRARDCPKRKKFNVLVAEDSSDIG
ncbi:hypothetical protein ACLB2K_043391 [Fragaria x ananassa]